MCSEISSGLLPSTLGEDALSSLLHNLESSGALGNQVVLAGAIKTELFGRALIYLSNLIFGGLSFPEV